MDMASTERPLPFSAYTTPDFWDDPHISERMLAEHLNPDSPMSSRPHEFMDRSVEWMLSLLGLVAGSRLLDLGCGPGLYSERLARRGVNVAGVDVAQRSLDYAAKVAREEHLPVQTIRGSYLDGALELGSGYDAVILIFEDYCALSPAQRALLLRRVRGALRPGGNFLFDITSAARFGEAVEGVIEEENLMDGFWGVKPYRGRHETWVYPELRLVLDRYTIRTVSESRVFWNWMQCLTPEEVEGELQAAGFEIVGLYGDVAGSPYDPASPTFAVRAA